MNGKEVTCELSPPEQQAATSHRPRCANLETSQHTLHPDRPSRPGQQPREICTQLEAQQQHGGMSVASVGRGIPRSELSPSFSGLKSQAPKTPPAAREHRTPTRGPSDHRDRYYLIHPPVPPPMPHVTNTISAPFTTSPGNKQGKRQNRAREGVVDPCQRLAARRQRWWW